MAEAMSTAIRVGLIRRFYDWGMEWVQRPYGVWILFLLAVAESSFFPIPPDVFLIVLAIGTPKRAFRYAAVCSAGSVLGGMLGYGLGLLFMDSVGHRIIDFYGLTDKFAVAGELYRQYDAWAVGAAGFTPIPYKLFTITAGAFHIDFPTFVLASVVSRSARFFMVAGFIYRFGAPVRYFIERYFNLLTILFLVLLVLGYLLIKWVL